MKTRFRRSIVALPLAFSFGDLFEQDAALTERFKQLDTHGDGKLTAGDHTRTLRVGERERRYRVYIAKKYDANKATPVIVVFHGGGGNPESMIRLKGGFGKGFLGRSKVTKFRSVEHTIQCWEKANGCNTKPEIVALPDVAKYNMKVARKTWSDGEDGSEFVLIEIEGGGHTWPGQKPIVSLFGESTMDISANDLMWEIFQKHPRRPTEKVKQDSK